MTLPKSAAALSSHAQKPKGNSTMRILLVADIHGNFPALTVVAAYQAALEIFSSSSSPYYRQITESNLKEALSLLEQRRSQW